MQCDDEVYDVLREMSEYRQTIWELYNDAYHDKDWKKYEMYGYGLEVLEHCVSMVEHGRMAYDYRA